MGQERLAWLIHFFFSLLRRADTKVTETSTAGPVRSCLGRGKGLWGRRAHALKLCFPCSEAVMEHPEC